MMNTKRFIREVLTIVIGLLWVSLTVVTIVKSGLFAGLIFSLLLFIGMIAVLLIVFAIMDSM